MGKTYRGKERQYLKDKYLREQNEREKRKIKEDARRRSHDNQSADEDTSYVFIQ